MHWYNWLLFPLSILFDVVTQTRNWAFEKGIFKVTEAQIPSILVGNLSLGGTGKTPMVEFLIRFISSNYRIGILSRGYGRVSKGFLEAGLFSNPAIIGDEPFQIYSKYGDKVSVFVGENRVSALQKIVNSDQVPDLMILDDAFQHCAFKANLNILLTTYQSPFFDDYLIPSGRLRERRLGSRRADLVIVSKCPELISEGVKNEFKARIRTYSGPKTPVLFSKITYGKPYSVGSNHVFSPSVVLVAGLANDELFIQYARIHFDVVDVMSFEDHHVYEASDFAKIQNLKWVNSKKEVGLLTTEKDAYKLKSIAEQGFLGEIPIFAIPISVVFSDEDEIVLKNLIDQKVVKNLSNQ